MGSVESADLLVDELSSFHIESKGTKAKTIAKSVLRAWYTQLFKDCGKKIPILFHRANGARVIGLVPACVVEKLQIRIGFLSAIRGKAFTPCEQIEDSVFSAAVAKSLKADPDMFRLALAFEVDTDKIFIAFDGQILLKEMLNYESRLRLAPLAPAVKEKAPIQITFTPANTTTGGGLTA